jgi:hypothetical protein
LNHQPEAQHPKIFSYPQAGRPITPSEVARRSRAGGVGDNQCTEQRESLSIAAIVPRHIAGAAGGDEFLS